MPIYFEIIRVVGLLSAASVLGGIIIRVVGLLKCSVCTQWN